MQSMFPLGQCFQDNYGQVKGSVVTDRFVIETVSYGALIFKAMADNYSCQKNLFEVNGEKTLL